MKNLLTLWVMLLACAVTAQDSYFTIYNFSVADEDVGTVYGLMDDYFSTNKMEGVTVSLYENHLKSQEYNFSHSVVFSGSSDALGAMYGAGQNAEWSLFLARINMHTDDFSSAMGETLAQYGDTSIPHPVSKVFILAVEEEAAFVEGYKKFHAAHNPEGRIASMGNVLSGHSDDGANFWIVNQFKDFKSAMEGPKGLQSEAEYEASSKAWEEYMATLENSKLIRSMLRFRLGQW